MDDRSYNRANITNNETGRNGQSNQNGIKKKIYIIGNSMVKHIKVWNLSNKLDQNCLYAWNFPVEQVKSMKDYTKPYIREEKSEHKPIILRIVTNELDSEKKRRTYWEINYYKFLVLFQEMMNGKTRLVRRLRNLKKCVKMRVLIFFTITTILT